MVQLFTLLLVFLGWGLGESIAPSMYPNNPETWSFVRAFCTAAPAGIFWCFTEARHGSSA